MTDAGARLYWSAIWRAAVSCGTFAIPIGVLQVWLIDSDQIRGSDPFNYLLNFAILCCGALGGFAAAKLAPTSPLQNGAAAAALTVIVIQVGGAIRHAIIGEDISNPLGWVLIALLMATFGMVGAWIHTKVTPSANGAN